MSDDLTRWVAEEADAAMAAEVIDETDLDLGPTPGPGGRRPAQRRQVDIGQPDPGSSRGRRRGRARRDPRPGGLRRHLARSAVHRGRHRGLGAGRDGAAARVAGQAEMAAAAADAVLLVVDATVGATDTDEAVVKVLRRSGKPVVLAANKVDDTRGESDAAGLWSLGLGQPFPVSALHGRGSGDLLDAILDALPEAPSRAFGDTGRPAPGGAAGQAERRQVRRCSTGSPARSGRSWTASPERHATRSTRSSSSLGRHGALSIQREFAAGCARRQAPSTTRACGRRARWRRPRWPSCSSTPASR